MRITILLVFAYVSAAFSQTGTDLILNISNYFSSGNVKEIAVHFSNTVNLTISNNENVYSKVQAEIILSDFIKNHHPRSAKILHRLDNNPNYQHAVIALETTNGLFRVAYSLRSQNDALKITEIRIEDAE